MQSKAQINAIGSAVHLLRTVCSEHTDQGGATVQETLLINWSFNMAMLMQQKLEKHFDMDGMAEEEWDQIPILNLDSMADYSEVEVNPT